jgi:hypothetical protein
MVHDVEQVARPQALEPQRQVVPGAVGPHQVFHHAVELTSLRGVHAGHPERPYEGLGQRAERQSIRSIEDRHARDQLGRGGVRGQIVGDADAVDEPAFGEAALIELRVLLERRGDDVPAHGLPVDDRPARAADLSHEQLAEGDQIRDEEMRLVLARAIAGRDPGMPLSQDVAGDRQHVDIAPPGPALNAVREHDEPAAPVGGHLDDVVGVPEPAGAIDRRGLRLCARRVRPGPARPDQGQTQHEQRDEGRGPPWAPPLSVTTAVAHPSPHPGLRGASSHGGPAAVKGTRRG